MGHRKAALARLDVRPQFWDGRRVVVTGHTGFKGAWMSLWLERLGAEVTGYALEPPSEPSLFDLARVADGMHSIHADVRDLARLVSEFSRARPEIVFHLAAQSLVHRSYEEPVETYGTNVLGTLHVLEAARAVGGVRAVVIVTSDKCYENNGGMRGYREDDPMGGSDPYSSSKGCAELLTASYRRSYFPPERHAEHGVALASARAGNVIGGGDWARDRLVPDIVRSVAAGRVVKIRRPDAVRPWQHVIEPVGGYLHLAKRLFEDGPEFAGGWNFGPKERDARPVSWVAERVTELWGDDAGWERDGAEFPPEAGYLRLDVSKARSLLAWESRLDLELALAWTVAWHRRQAAGEDPRALTLEQIAAYEASAASS